MSCYIYFFIKHNSDFIELTGGYSRNSTVFNVFRDMAPYECVRKLTPNLLNDVRHELMEYMRNSKNQHEQVLEEMKFIRDCNGITLQERLERFEDLKSLDKDIKEDYEELKRVQYFTGFLSDMIEDKKEIYFGLEIYDPTEKDIVNY